MKNFISIILAILVFIPVNIFLVITCRNLFPCSLEVIKDEWESILGGEPPDDADEEEATLACGWHVLYQERQEGKLTDEELASKVTQLIKGGKE